MNIYYINANTGNDSNSGLSPTSAWRTLAKHNASSISPGSRVLLHTSGVWHEMLLPKTGVTYSSYGSHSRTYFSGDGVPSFTDMPVINGSDTVREWVADAQNPGCYSTALGYSAIKVFVDATYAENLINDAASLIYVSMKVYGDPTYRQTTPLNTAGSLEELYSSPGSMFMDVAAGKLHIQLEDSSDPNDHVIEVSGARSYGIHADNVPNVTIDGIAVIRTAFSGYLGQGSDTTAANHVIKNCVFFNNGAGLSDGALSGPIMGAIFIQRDYVSPASIPGFESLNNFIGRMDYPHGDLNYTQAGIYAAGTTGAIIRGCKVATINGWGIRVADYYSSQTIPCLSNAVSACELTNCEGNIAVVGAQGTSVIACKVHDSLGNGVQAGTGINSACKADGLTLIDNLIYNLRSAYGGQLYNGFDINYVQNGIANRNTIYSVSNSCMTLEADVAPSSGWTIYNNHFDATLNVWGDGSAPSGNNRVYPLYVRDTSLTGINPVGNTLVVNPSTPYIKIGATSAGDLSQDLTLAQFSAKYASWIST